MKKLILLISVCSFVLGSLHASWTSAPPGSAAINTNASVSSSGAANPGFGISFLVIWVQSPSGTWTPVAVGTGVNNATINNSGSKTLDASGTWNWTVRLQTSGPSGSPTGTQLASATTTVGPTATTFSFSNLSFTYDGGTKTASVTPSPGNATYSSDLTKGPGAGSYTVSATANGSFSGSGSATLTINQANQATLTLNASTSQQYDLTQTLSASGGTGGGGVSYVITGWSTANNASISGAVLTANGSSGWVDVRADKAADANYNAASSAAVRIYLTTRTTSFSFGNLSHTYDGSTKTATTTPSPSGATYSSDLTKGPGAGSYTVSATANGNYSGSGSATLTINQANQATLTLNAATSQQYGLTQTLSTSGGSGGGGVSYVITGQSAGGNASVSGAVLTANASSGWVDVRADKAADANYNAASSAGVRVYLTTRVTTFSFGNLSHTYDGNTKTATASPTPSGATYTSDLTKGPTANSYTVTTTGNGNYSGGGSATLLIGQAGQSITFNNPGTQTYGTPLTLGATASSGLAVSYAVTSGPATLSGSTLTFTGTGSVTITASQAGNTNYSAASNVAQAFTVNAQPTTFALSQTSYTYNTSAQGPTINPTPGGATFTPGGTLSATNVGSYNATATATGNFTGSNSSLGWSIAKANQTITFNNPGTQTYGTPLNLGATASSGLTVTYAVISGPATVSGNTVTFTGTGSVTVRASQAGNANYNAAANVDQSFTVNAQPTTFALSQTSYTYNGSAQGPTINPTPGGATFTPGGTLSATNVGSYNATATATGNFTGSNSSLGWSIAKANQTITFNNPGTQTYGTPLTLGATASSGLTVTYAVISGPVTVSGNTVTFTGTGSVTVRASQAGNSNYNVASDVDRTFSVNTSSQTITFNNPGTQTYGTPLTLGATASSGLAVSYAITSGPATLSGGTLTFTGTGSVTITASQAGNANYSAASNVAQTFTVNPRTTTFALSQPSFTYNGSAQGPTINPTPGGATFTSGGTLSATNVGSYTATATATGNYSGSNSSLGWNIAAGSQTISFSNPGTQTYGTPLTLGATASSGLTVTYAVTSGPATVSGSTVTFTGTGSVTVTASQGGNSNYGAATPVAQTFTVNPANQTITFNNPGAQTYGAPLTLGATASSGLGVTYAIVSGPATVSGNVVTFTGTGTVVVRASQAGNANYNAAGNVDQSFAVNPSSQTITFGNPGVQTYGTPLTLGATASSGLTVAYAVTSGPATVSGNTVTFTGTGSVTVTASQAGNANYNAASNVGQTFTVNKATPTGTFANRTLGAQTSTTYTVQAGELNATFAGPGGYATPTGTSTYSIVGPGTAVTAGSTLALGSYTIRASYPGDGNYNAATKDATWTVSDDGDGDGVKDYIEIQLGTNPSVARQTDSANQAEQNIHRPN